MPVYEYMCDSCGAFTAIRSMRERDEPQVCPACQVHATRLILTAPASYCADSGARRAHAVNERASHEPRRLSTKAASVPSEPAAKPIYKSGHGCGRPWMIGH
jgi:putative FmdB family regulatory protein